MRSFDDIGGGDMIDFNINIIIGNIGVMADNVGGETTTITDTIAIDRFAE